jgi:hypothetical protein
MPVLVKDVWVLIFDYIDRAELLHTIFRVCKQWKLWAESVSNDKFSVTRKIKKEIDPLYTGVSVALDSYLAQSTPSWLQKAALIYLFLRHRRQLSDAVNNTAQYPCIDLPSTKGEWAKKIIALPDRTYANRFVTLHGPSSFPSYADLFVSRERIFSNEHVLVYADGYRQYCSARLAKFSSTYFEYLCARQKLTEYEAHGCFLELEKIVPMFASLERSGGGDFCAHGPAFVYSSARKRDKRVAASYAVAHAASMSILVEKRENTPWWWLARLITCTHDITPPRLAVQSDWKLPVRNGGIPLHTLEHLIYTEEEKTQGTEIEADLETRLSSLLENSEEAPPTPLCARNWTSPAPVHYYYYPEDRVTADDDQVVAEEDYETD